MIVSFQYKFIFIKTHKTAGSSFEKAVGPLCGSADVVTPMDELRPEEYAKNYYPNTLLGRFYAKNRLFRKCISRRSSLLQPWFWEHMPASRVFELVGEKIWSGFDKVCVERNPWDKVVSYYLWKKHGQGKRMPDFKTYVMTKSHRLPLDGELYVDEEGHLMVDHVIQFRKFKSGLQDFMELKKIPFKGPWPSEKKGERPGRKPYVDYYDRESREKIANLFTREIKLFGYEFGSDQ